jgi:hypothetical protein
VDVFDSTFGLTSTNSPTLYSQYGAASTFLTQVGQSSSSPLPANDAGWALEISNDVEWAHSIAPGAKIILVETNDNTLGNLLTGVQYAATLANVVAMSWGGPEFSGEQTQDSTYFTAPKVTYVAATGDVGGTTQWPATSPDVLAVGGTTLRLKTTNAWKSETGWNGSGGGISAYESQPSYQTGIVTQSSTKRTIPDVAYDANTKTGFIMYDSYPYNGYSGGYIFGGTSAGTPQIAAMVAIANRGRSSKLDTTQVLTTLYQVAGGSSYASDFHDITSGTAGTFSAGTGYDLVTGLGSPIGKPFIAALHSTTVPSGVAVPIAHTTPGGTAGLDLATAGTPGLSPLVATTSSTVAPAPQISVASASIAVATPLPALSAATAPAPGSSSAPSRPLQGMVRPWPGASTFSSAGLDAARVRLGAASLEEIAARSFDPTPVDPAVFDSAGAIAVSSRAWDEAVASYLVDDGSALPLDQAALPPLAGVVESLPTGDVYLMAGAAVVVWGAWRIRSEKSKLRRLQQAPG